MGASCPQNPLGPVPGRFKRSGPPKRRSGSGLRDCRVVKGQSLPGNPDWAILNGRARFCIPAAVAASGGAGAFAATATVWHLKLARPGHPAPWPLQLAVQDAPLGWSHANPDRAARKRRPPSRCCATSAVRPGRKDRGSSCPNRRAGSAAPTGPCRPPAPPAGSKAAVSAPRAERSGARSAAAQRCPA